MKQRILVCTDGSDYSKTACDYAFYFAGLHAADVSAIHVLDSRMLEAPVMVDNAGWIGAEPFSDQLQLFREVTEKKGEAVVKAFNELAESQKMKTEINVSMGHPPAVILDTEKETDLLIVGQKGEDAHWIGAMIGSTAERIARHTTKPCMITPQNFMPVSRILLAFDGSEHAREALTMATSYSKENGVELMMICVADGIDAEKNERVAGEGMALIQSHGCKAELLMKEGDAETEILEAISEQKCDLLIVGAYGHSRIREMILGSTTSHLIAKTDIPILLVR